MIIDFAYDKHAAWPDPVEDTTWKYRGYSGPRDGDVRLVVVHSTEGQTGSTFAHEAEYIRDSPDISAHYLVGKDGRITRLLDPLWVAWHAGTAWWEGETDVNGCSIGIECHHTDGEMWPDAQVAALAWLVAELGTAYTTLEAVTSHRTVATPAGRKSDPTCMTDAWMAAHLLLHPEADK